MDKRRNNTSDVVADEAMREGWKAWLAFWTESPMHMGHQRAFEEIMQPIMRQLADGRYKPALPCAEEGDEAALAILDAPDALKDPTGLVARLCAHHQLLSSPSALPYSKRELSYPAIADICRALAWMMEDINHIPDGLLLETPAPTENFPGKDYKPGATGGVRAYDRSAGQWGTCGAFFFEEAGKLKLVPFTPDGEKMSRDVPYDELEYDSGR